MSEYELGRHAQAIEVLDERTKRIERKLDGVVSMLDQRKGERRATAAWAAAIGGAVSLLLSLVVRLWQAP